MADPLRKKLQIVLVVLIALLVVVLVVGGVLLATRANEASTSIEDGVIGTALDVPNGDFRTYSLPAMTGIPTGSAGDYNPQDYEWATIPALCVDYPGAWTATPGETKAEKTVIDEKNGFADFVQGVTFTSPDGSVKVSLFEYSGRSGGAMGSVDTPGLSFNLIENTGIPGADVYEYISQSGSWTYRSIELVQINEYGMAAAPYLYKTTVSGSVGVKNEKGEYSSVDVDTDLDTPVMQQAIAILASLRWAEE